MHAGHVGPRFVVANLEAPEDCAVLRIQFINRSVSDFIYAGIQIFVARDEHADLHTVGQFRLNRADRPCLVDLKQGERGFFWGR